MRFALATSRRWRHSFLYLPVCEFYCRFAIRPFRLLFRCRIRWRHCRWRNVVGPTYLRKTCWSEIINFCVKRTYSPGLHTLSHVSLSYWRFLVTSRFVAHASLFRCETLDCFVTLSFDYQRSFVVLLFFKPILFPVTAWPSLLFVSCSDEPSTSAIQILWVIATLWQVFRSLFRFYSLPKIFIQYFSQLLMSNF